MCVSIMRTSLFDYGLQTEVVLRVTEDTEGGNTWTFSLTITELFQI